MIEKADIPMYRVLVAPDFEIAPSNPDFPPDILDALKTARDKTGSNYVSFWAAVGETGLKSHIVVSTYPSAWLEEYTQEMYSRIDPVIQDGLNSVGAVLFDHENPDDEKLEGLAEGALRHGIGRFTVGIPAHFAPGIHTVTTYATDNDLSASADENDEFIVKCREQAYILGLAIIERFLKKDPPKVNLTKREIEVLYWGSRGKTDQQTSEIMGISRWTVVAHTQSAKAKLRVNNKAAAVARALELHLFDKFDHKL
jgi:LuxR family transcriptional activator of conjugal transfer of Ti plasmids